jgi:hypothetical protein
MLKKRGFDLRSSVEVPYHEWYRHGWLCDKEANFDQRVVHALYERLVEELDLIVLQSQ